MTIRLNVTYAATDGSMPESVEIEWTNADRDSDAVLATLDRLLAAPRERLDVVTEASAEKTPLSSHSSIY